MVESSEDNTRYWIQFQLIEPTKKIPYPKSVFFIVTNEFCERFTFYGLRTILALYLNYMLGYSSDTATVIYHVFNMFAYFFPVLGAIIADSWLGKYKTILYLSIVYAIGNVIVAVTAITTLNLPQRELTIVGLLLIAIGTGGIKPCVSAFGGDQFILPQQEVALQKFFSVFYFSVNAGSFISTFVTPVLREDVHCFGDESCFSLAFGVPAVLMGVSIVAFVLGSGSYRIKQPEGNIIVKVCSCMWYAMKKSSKKVKRDHWLDKADDKFDKKFIEEVKATLKVLVLYIPLPIFWALFDQQGSRWTFQATRMSGEFPGFTLKPDQMQVVNPVLILLFIPMFETIVYPVFAKCNILKKPLQRLTIGGLLGGVAFVVSAIVEFQLEGTYAVLPVAGEGQLRIFNVMGCTTNFTIGDDSAIELGNLQMYSNLNIPVNEGAYTEFTIKWNSCVENKAGGSQLVKIRNEQATSFTLYNDFELFPGYDEDLDKSDNGDPMVMLIYNKIESTPSAWFANITFLSDDEDIYTAELNSTTITQTYSKIPTGKEFGIAVNGKKLEGTVTFKQGGGYVFMITEDQTLSFNSVQVTEPNSVNMLWLIPQYVIITAGEVMFSITGLEFSFTQAPVSMKSFLTSMWLLAVAFGNLIVIIIAEAKFFDSQAYEFLLFAGLMFVDMFIFALMAMRYKPVEPKATELEYEKEETELNGNTIQLEEKN